MSNSHQVKRACIDDGGRHYRPFRPQNSETPENYTRHDSSDDSSDGEGQIGQFYAPVGTRLNHRYEYTGHELGIGTFGKVISCVDTVSQTRCAIKVIRSVKRYVESAQEEISVLQKISHRQNAKAYKYIVHLLNSFDFQRHVCLVFEELGESLWDAQQACGFRAFHLHVIRHILHNVFTALDFLHREMHVVHTDIKLENILFARPATTTRDCCNEIVAFPERYDVKLIDFGNATYYQVQETAMVTVNTRQYRAPEVILGLEWGPPSDLFGAACLGMELRLGQVLFDSENVSHHLLLMETLRDYHRFPEWMIRMANLYQDVFDPHTHHVITSSRRKRRGRTLSELLMARKDDSTLLGAFYRVMWTLLHVDPHRRGTASQTLLRSFFHDD